MSHQSTLLSQIAKKDRLGKRLAEFAKIKEHAPLGDEDDWADLYQACEQEGWI
jgi:hypothetical protein